MPRTGFAPALAPRLVGDPIDTLTGAAVDRRLEFRLVGPLDLLWYRHYNSAQSHRSFGYGWGHGHDFDRTLLLQSDQVIYHGPMGLIVEFPFLQRDGAEIARDGFLLRRATARRYQLFRHGESAMEFTFSAEQPATRVARLFGGTAAIVFHYSAAGLLETIVDSAARVIQVVELADRRLSRLSLEEREGAAEQLLMSYDYDERGNLVATRNGAGHGHRFVYDTANRLVRVVGRKGFQFYFEYDQNGRCISTTGDEGFYGVALNYKVPGRLTVVRRVDGGEWSYLFERTGELSKIIDPFGGEQRFVRDDRRRVVLEVDPNGNQTRILYNAAGAATARIDVLNQWESIPEEPNPPEPEDERFARNAAEYIYGRLVDVRQVSLPTRDRLATLDFAPEVRRMVVVRPDGERQSISPPFEVRPVGVCWWPAPRVGRVFNVLGKLIRQEDDFGRLRRWSYDAASNLAQYIDFDGGRWTYDHGAWHVLQSFTSPVGAQVHFSYTSNADIASCMDAGGTLSEYQYDLKDRLIEVHRHGVLRDRYVLDAAGDLIAKYAADGRELLRLENGPGGLPLKRTLASGDEHTLRYDSSGRYLLAATRKDRVEFSYDGLGNLTLETRNGLGVSYRYHGWRSPSAAVFLGKFVVQYERVDEGTLRITDPGGQSHVLQFDGNGFVTCRFGNGTERTEQFDNRGRSLFCSLRRPGARSWSRQYHWSGEGELLRVDDDREGVVRHEYDTAHRLRRRFVVGRVEEYEHDIADNLIRQPGLADVSLRPGNRLNTANGSTFQYDDRNHIEVRETSAGLIRYVRDSRDQLTRVETPQGIWKADYDALQRRTRKTWAGETTEFYWSGNQLVAEINHDGRVRLYVYADQLGLTPILCLEYASLSASPESCRRYFVVTDQVGAPCLVQDEMGAEVWRARIAPFGYAEIASTSTIEFNLRFPGHYCDRELGLHYNLYRYYDPVLGRYLESDPAGISGGYNVYAYRTNPLLTVDARGLGDDDKKPKPKAKPAKKGKDKEGSEPPSDADKSSPDKPLKDMSPEELKAHVDKRATELKQAMIDDNPRQESATTLSVGVVEKDGDPSTRKVVITTSDDNQKFPESVVTAKKPDEELRPTTDPTIVRGPSYENPQFDENKPQNPQTNPKTKSDTFEVDPNTNERTPYTKAKDGEPVEGTKHHAEQRMENNTEPGEKVLAQQPTKPCCDGCKKVLGDNGDLDKIPNP